MLPHAPSPVGRRAVVSVSAVLAAVLSLTGAKPAIAAAIVAADLVGNPRSFSPSALGLNGNNVSPGIPWSDSRFKRELGSFRPGNLRYPGGTIANYWAWRNGWFQPNGPWPGQPSTRIDNSLATFAEMVRATSATPVFDVNMLTYQGAIASEAKNLAMLDDQILMLRAAKRAGLPVRFVELGNEFYLTKTVGGTHYPKRFPTATDYARQANPWVTAIHSAFPGAKVAAVGTDANGVVGIQQRRLTWNATVLKTLEGADALTLHTYIYVTDPRASLQALLTRPWQRFQQLQANEFKVLRSNGLKAWITEYNLDDRTSELAFAGRWMHGLFAATMTLLFLREPLVAQMSMHNVLGNAHDAAIFSNSRGFRTTSPATTAFALTAAGTSMALIERAARSARSVQTLSFSPSPTIGGAPALVGSLLAGTGRQSVVLNLSPQSIELRVSSLFSGSFNYEQLKAPLGTRVTGPNVVTVGEGTSTGTITLAPHSISRLFQ